MIKLSHDEKRNRVTLTYEGNVDVGEAEDLYLRLQALMPKCRRGFKALADLSSADTIEKETLPVFRKVMDLLNQHGISEVIRVVPDPEKDIGFNILSVFHYDKDVKVHTCQSLEQVPW
jgi:hypothetical protein